MHDLALALAMVESVDITILQEPWILSVLEKKITEQHPNYSAFDLNDNWEVRS